MGLENDLSLAFRMLEIVDSDKKAILAFLAPLKEKSSVTHLHYEHSLRVGILARRMARFMHLDEKALFFAGVLHDLGKCSVALEVLGNTGIWKENDYREIRRHVTDGFRMIKGRFDFAASIIVWHHKFQKNGYPKIMPKRLHNFSEGTKVLIAECGRVLALADVYDALHRVNSKFGNKAQLSGKEIKEKMFELNPDRKGLIADFYKHKIISIN